MGGDDLLEVQLQTFLMKHEEIPGLIECVCRAAAGERLADGACASGSSLRQGHGELQPDQLGVSHLLQTQPAGEVHDTFDCPL